MWVSSRNNTKKKLNKEAGELELLCENMFLQGHVSDVFFASPEIGGQLRGAQKPLKRVHNHS